MNHLALSAEQTAGRLAAYLVATGGNPGAGTNPNAALMAALGDCGTLSASTYVSVNEVTTVGSVFALAPFMSSIAAMGSSAANTTGLMRAFASVNKLVNVATGAATGSALPPGAVGPTSEIATLADVLAPCVNSTGGTAGDSTACGTLFSLATPAGGTAPTDTVQAALNIAHNPTLNVAALYNTTTPTAPFAPQLTSAPSDWTLAITYSTGSFSKPTSTTVDAAGNIWVANSSGNSVSVLSQAGNPLSGSPFTGNGLNAPAAIVIDQGGNAWVANAGGSSVSAFNGYGSPYTGSPFAGNGRISAPASIAIDAPGNIWIANSGNSSITELTAAGTFTQQVSTGSTKPVSLAIDPK